MIDPSSFLNRRGPTCPLIGGFTSNAACLREECVFWKKSVCMWTHLVDSMALIALGIGAVVVSSAAIAVILLVWIVR